MMRSVLITAIVMTFLFLTALSPLQEWTKEEAVKEFNRIFSVRLVSKGQMPTREQMKTRANSFRQWRHRVQTSKLNLEESDFLMPIALYISANATDDPAATRTAAGKEMLDLFLSKGKIPDGMKPYAGLIDRNIGIQVFASIQADDYVRARNLINIYFDFAGMDYMFFTTFGKELLKKNTDGSKSLLAELLARAMNSEEFNADDKNNIMLYIYGGPSGDGSVPTVNFVPFKEKTMEGKEISVEDFRGKVLLIDFWATWCGPCLKEMPNVVEAYRKFNKLGLEIVGVSLDGPNMEEKIRSTEKKLGMSWPQIYDGGYQQAHVAKINNITSIPDTFLFDRSGRARYKGLRGEELLKKIEELLNEKPLESTGVRRPRKR